MPCFNKEIFSNSIFKALFLNELVDRENKQEILKTRYDPSSEAKIIIKKASEDLKKMNLS